jgi:type III secretion protein V
MGQPRAWLVAAAAAIGLGLIPGMPTAVFVTLAVIIGAVGYGMTRAKARPATADDEPKDITAMASMAPTGEKRPIKKDEPGNEFAPTVPLIMDVAAELGEVFKADMLNDELIRIRRALYFDLGVPFPGIQLRFNDRLPKGTYSLLLNEVPVSQGQLRPGYLFVREKEDNLKALGVTYETDKRFLPNLDTIWAPDAAREALTKAGVSVMEPTQVLTYHVAFVLKKYAGEFIGIQETKFLLNAMESRFPDLVKEAQRVMPVQKIAEILQRLTQEEISVRNLRSILEALVEWGQKEKDSVLLVEYVRSSLKRHVSYKHSSGQNMLPAYLFAPNVEDTIRSAIRQTSAGSYLALDPNVTRKLLENIKRTVGDLSRSTARPVLLTSMDIRRYVRKMIEQDLYDLPVVSYQELTPEINIQPLARIEL